jgi:hypothetical protein
MRLEFRRIADQHLHRHHLVVYAASPATTAAAKGQPLGYSSL